MDAFFWEGLARLRRQPILPVFLDRNANATDYPGVEYGILERACRALERITRARTATISNVINVKDKKCFAIGPQIPNNTMSRVGSAAESIEGDKTLLRQQV